MRRTAPFILGAVAPPARVLIVDDERANRQLLEVMLGPEGFTLLSAASGEEALAMVASQPPDLILLDIMMPGMDGYEVVSRLKADPGTRNVPVIMVSALDDRPARMIGLQAGAEDFLTKPVDRAELCARVRNLLRLKAYADYHDHYSQLLEGEVEVRTTALIESESLYRETFDAAPVGIVHMGLTGEWLRVNQRLCEILGYSCEELIGTRAQVLVQSDTAAVEAEAVAEIVKTGSAHYVIEEKRYRRHDGSAVWARVTMSLHRDGDGRPQHCIAVIEDITERRALEAQFRQANKMDAIGQLASGVAHDFNNLLTVILGFAGFVRDDAVADNRHCRDIDEITKAAQRAAGLTKQLLAFSRQQVLNAEPLDVNQLITDMIGMLGRLIGENIHVSLALAPDLSSVLADRSQLEQVVMNLVVNARDAMPNGGSVTIETADVDLENSSFHEEAIMRGPYVMLAVTDTGTGMSAETRRHLFEPFFTTKDLGKGTGLGLSTTYGIVKQSKGYIWVYSEPGKGTTFKVYLPRASAGAQVHGHPMTTSAPVEQSDVTVLLVEDEPSVRDFTKRLLEKSGYLVLEASSGPEAEDLFTSSGGAIDLLLTDMIMPGYGGLELLTRLQMKMPELRVLFMSGYTERTAAHKAGIDRGLPFLQKPFTAADLRQRVREALDR